MELLAFGNTGWGDELFIATLMTLAVSITAMIIGFLFALIFTPLKLSKNKFLNLIANSYTTNLIPDTEQISINQITISNKLDCNSENTNLCDELLAFFKNATEFNFLANEEFAKVVDGKKNIYIIKGNFSGGDKKVNASLFYSVHENYFKGDIIIDTPSEFTSTRDRSISISIKGKK